MCWLSKVNWLIKVMYRNWRGDALLGFYRKGMMENRVRLGRRRLIPARRHRIISKCLRKSPISSIKAVAAKSNILPAVKVSNRIVHRRWRESNVYTYIDRKVLVSFPIIIGWLVVAEFFHVPRTSWKTAHATTSKLARINDQNQKTWWWLDNVLGIDFILWRWRFSLHYRQQKKSDNETLVNSKQIFCLVRHDRFNFSLHTHCHFLYFRNLITQTIKVFTGCRIHVLQNRSSYS